MNSSKAVQRELVGGPKDGLVVSVREEQRYVEIRTEEGICLGVKSVGYYSHIYEISIDGKYRHVETRFT